MGQNFPGIQIPSSSATVPTPAIAGQKSSGIERNATNVIDLRSSSSGPSATQAIAGSDVSVASTSNNGGKLQILLVCRNKWMLHHSPKCLRRQHGSPKSHHAFMGAALRMSILGHPLCVTTSPSWEVVMPNRSRTP